MAISIGCGSWADAEYTGILYPPGWPAKERLKGYAKRFSHVEVNSTYYAIPRETVVKSWIQQTPPGFIFDLKLHRAFSQSPAKTAAAGELVKRLLAAAEPLIAARRLGVFLLVLPPSFSPERHQLSELDGVIEKLAPHLLAVELRHSDWVSRGAKTETLAYFRRRKAVWVAVDMPKIKGSTLMPAVDEATHPELAYLRLHGRNPKYLEAKTAEEGHSYAYAPRELKSLVTRIETLAEQATNVRVVANNHAEDFAPRTALALKELFKRCAKGAKV